MRTISIFFAAAFLSSPLFAAKQCPSQMSEINSKNLVRLCLKTRPQLEEWRNWLVEEKVSEGSPVFRISKRSGQQTLIAVLPKTLGVSGQDFTAPAKDIQALGIQLPKQTGLLSSVSKKNGLKLKLESSGNSRQEALRKTLDSWKLLGLMAKSEQRRLSQDSSNNKESKDSERQFKRLVRVNRFLEALDAVQQRLAAENKKSTHALTKSYTPKTIHSPSLSSLKNVWHSNKENESVHSPDDLIAQKRPSASKPVSPTGNIQLQNLDPDRSVSNIPSPGLKKRQLQMEKAVRKAFFGTPHWDKAKELLSQAMDANEEALSRVSQKLASLWDRVWYGKGPNPFKNWANCVSNSSSCR